MWTPKIVLLRCLTVPVSVYFIFCDKEASLLRNRNQHKMHVQRFSWVSIGAEYMVASQ